MVSEHVCMGDDTFLGMSRDQQNGLLFALGLVFVVASTVFSGGIGGPDVIFRISGYVMLVYAPIAFLYDRVV